MQQRPDESEGRVQGGKEGLDALLIGLVSWRQTRTGEPGVRGGLQKTGKARRMETEATLPKEARNLRVTDSPAREERGTKVAAEGGLMNSFFTQDLHEMETLVAGRSVSGCQSTKAEGITEEKRRKRLLTLLRQTRGNK